MNLQKVTVLLLGAICLVLFSVALDYAQPVLLPLIIAILLSFVLAPAVQWLNRYHIPKIIAIFLVILMILGIFFLIGLFFYTSFQSFLRVFPRYQMQLQTQIEALSADLGQRLGMPTGILEDIDWARMIRDGVVSLSGSFVDFVTNMFVITIFLIFLLLERPFFQEKLEAAFEKATSMKIGRIMEHVNRQIGRYLALKLLISTATGVMIWISVTLIGLEFPIIWASLGFLLNFVPSIGSTLHFAGTSLFAFIQFYPASPGRVLAVVISMLAIQSVFGNFLDPRLQGRRLNLSPFLVLFSLIFWGWLWGAVGMLLATPLTVAVRIVCENIPALHPVSVLMGRNTGVSVRKRDEPS